MGVLMLRQSCRLECERDGREIYRYKKLKLYIHFYRRLLLLNIKNVYVIR